MTDLLLNDLKAAIVDGQAVVVVGAGVSMAATGGEPVASWTGLLMNGVERVVQLNLAPSAGWAERQRDAINGET